MRAGYVVNKTMHAKIRPQLISCTCESVISVVPVEQLPAKNLKLLFSSIKKL